MTGNSTTPSHPEPPPSGPSKITPHDVAAATAVGAAFRLGWRRRKDKVAEGAAVGTVKATRNSGRGQLLTVLAVVVAMVGMLAVMIVIGT